MKFIKKINEFFGQEEEIERDDIFSGNDEEEGDFYFDEEKGHDEEEGDFSHEEENWGDEESSSLGTSRISSFDDYSFDEPSFDETEGNLANKDLEDEMANFNFKNDDEDDFSEEEFDPSVHHLEFSEEDKDDCDTCEHDDEDKGGLDSPETDETSFVESFKAFNEKKKLNAGLKAFLDKKAGKKSKDDEKEDDKKEDDKKEEKGGKGLTAAQKKLPEALRKAIEKKSKK